MLTTIDTNELLFKTLKDSNVCERFGGGLYVGDDRPLDSEQVDIVVNTITLTQDYIPQRGISNVNIYVPDRLISIDNKQQKKADWGMLNMLTKEVLKILENSVIKGISTTIEGQGVAYDTTIKQHYSNIRISWNIQSE